MHEAAATPSSLISIALIIDSVGVLAGIFAVIIVGKSLSRVGGQVGSAFSLILLGVISQIAALLESLLVADLKVLPELNLGGIIQSHQIHDILMVIGMIFFVLGAKKFSDLSA